MAPEFAKSVHCRRPCPQRAPKHAPHTLAIEGARRPKPSQHYGLTREHHGPLSRRRRLDVGDGGRGGGVPGGRKGHLRHYMEKRLHKHHHSHPHKQESSCRASGFGRGTYSTLLDI